MKKLLLVTALMASAMAPIAIAQAGYPDNGKTVVQAKADGNGSGGIPLQLYAYNCTTSCYFNTCYTNCY